MHCYQSLEAAALDITRRHPAWIDTLIPTTDMTGGKRDMSALDVISRIVNSDTPDPTESDAIVRRLVDIGRTEPDALAILLQVLARRLRKRISSNALPEYHADVLSTLAMAFLDSPLDKPRVVVQVLNRAHNRVWRQRVSERHRGTVHPLTVDPCQPDVLADMHDRRHAQDDIADQAVRNADLINFANAIQIAVANGELPASAWVNYRDLHLRHVLVSDATRSTGDRVRAHRAINSLQHLVERHLALHAT